MDDFGNPMLKIQEADVNGIKYNLHLAQIFYLIILILNRFSTLQA